jgi:hypothetical protein
LAAATKRRDDPTDDRPMRYWIDTEFIERPFAIDLISIGLAAEDGREFYAESLRASKSSRSWRGRSSSR